MNYVIGAAVGLLWGAVIAWVNSRINKNAIAESLNVDTEDDDYIENTTFANTITITFSSSGNATVSGDDAGIVSITGNDVVVNNETGKVIKYILTGETNDGFFKLYSTKKQAIVLNGVKITNPDGAAINNQSKKRTFIVLNDGSNPHLLLDYSRFISESCIRFAGMQADIIRRYKKPEDFITTNGLFTNLDNHRMQNEILDVYTYDSYPDFAYELDKSATDLKDRMWTRNLIEARSVCPHFGIMEQQSGGGGWVNRMEMPAPRPGQLTLWAMQSVAQGADYISFFRWRTAAFGTELYWHGILDYDNRDKRMSPLLHL